MRKRVVIAAVLAAVAIATMLVLRDGSSATTAAPATATVEIRDLTRTETLNGVVAYQDLRGLTVAQSGIITWLPAVGQDLGPGAVLLSINARPVVLLAGPIPAWRDLKPGMTDGPDIGQLEASLFALGYGISPDNHWDWHTSKAMKAFQEKVGADKDGVLSLGEVVFAEGNVHIAKLDGNVGGLTSPGASVLTVQSTERVVTLEVDPVKRDLITADAPVAIELPSGTKISGKIASVSTTLTQNADGKSVHLVTVTLDDPGQVAGLALAPVTVHYVVTVGEQVLSVPVASIIGVPGGGYAVNVIAKDGGTKRIPVTLGTWGDGYVQVSGKLSPGMKVQVPA